MWLQTVNYIIFHNRWRSLTIQKQKRALLLWIATVGLPKVLSFSQEIDKGITLRTVSKKLF